MILCSTCHHKNVRRLMRERGYFTRNNGFIHTIKPPTEVLIPEILVMIQLVERDRIDDVVIVVLYWLALPLTTTILLIDTKVLQGDGLRTSTLTFLSQLI